MHNLFNDKVENVFRKSNVSSASVFVST